MPLFHHKKECKDERRVELLKWELIVLAPKLLFFKETRTREQTIKHDKPKQTMSMWFLGGGLNIWGEII